MLARVLMYVDEIGLTYGRQILSTLFFFIPRRVWASKPIVTGAMVSGAQNANFTNLSAPLISEGYIDFGIVGIVVFSVLLAYALKKIDKYYWLVKDSECLDIIEIVYPFLIGFLIFMLRGALQPVVIFMFTFYLYSVLLYFLFNRKYEEKVRKNEKI